jgi:hypothetical protein
MKKYIVFFCLMAAVSLLRANPIKITYLNEFMLTPSGWKLELHSPAQRLSLNGVMIKSKTDSAYFQPWAVADTGYYVITPDSLSKPLSIDPQGDVITLSRLGYELERLRFGDPVVLRYGQSLCWSNGGFFYLDNSPTFGFANDILNAQGTLTLLVTDGTQPMSDATVAHYDGISQFPDIFRITDGDGRASLTTLARTISLTITKQFYITQTVSYLIYPESTVTRIVQLQSVNSVHDQQQQPDTYFLCDPFPNPFNPSTTIRYSLPTASIVAITITDINGRVVEKFLQRREEAGWKEIQWQTNAPSGIYFCTLDAVRTDGTHRTYKETKKIFLLR